MHYSVEGYTCCTDKFWDHVKVSVFAVALQKLWTHPDDFRASIMRRSARGLEHRPHRLERGHPEVCDLDVVLVVQQKVLRLQIAVAKQNQLNLKHMEMFILCSLRLKLSIYFVVFMNLLRLYKSYKFVLKFVFSGKKWE